MREVRILIQWRNSLRKLCKVAFSNTDASLYLFPYANQGTFHFGSRKLPTNDGSLTFDFSQDLSQELTPKLSIHERGQVHVYAGGIKAGPLFIPPLATLSGQHIATVSPDAFESLPMFSGKIREEGAEIDHIVPAVDEAINGRMAIYANGYRPTFDAQDCRLTFTLRRETLARPVYFGMKALGQPHIGIDAQKGVTIIAGWNPLQPITDDIDFLYIRGE